MINYMVSLKTKIVGNWQDFVRFKNKLIISDEYKAFLAIFGNILLYGVLGGFTYLAFVSPNILIKFLGIGCGLVLFQEKIINWIINIFNSFTLVKNYR